MMLICCPLKMSGREHVGKEYCYNLGIDATAPMIGMGGELSPTWGYKHTDEAKEKIGVSFQRQEV
jgi:hypothetical protein